MALDLTRAAHASPNTDLKLADQRSRLINLFSLFLASLARELRQSHGHCISMGPEDLILSPLFGPE